MKQAPRRREARSEPLLRILSGVVILASILIPMLFWRGMRDAFRIPKEIALRLESVIIVCLIALECVRRGEVKWLYGPDRKAFCVVLAIVAWAGLTTLTSVNRSISAVAFVRIAALCVIFLATVVLARSFRPVVLALILIPAAVNAAFFLLQDMGVWNPFNSTPSIAENLAPSNPDPFLESDRFSTALLGNTNDVGGYLALAAVSAAAILGYRRLRMLIWPLLLLLCMAVLFSRSLSAIAALIAGLIAVAFLRSRRLGIIIAVASPIAILAATAVHRPLAVRLNRAVFALRSQHYDLLLSNRLVPFATAWQMARDHPLVGVGPGCFAFEYLPYRLHLEAMHPSLLGAGEVGVNFGEVHNDHLQVLAETGIPGFALMLASLVLIGSRSFQRRQELARDQQQMAVGKWLAFPMVVTFAVLAIGHFPLELAESAQFVASIAALSVGWTST